MARTALDTLERLIDALLSEGLAPDDDSSEDYRRAFQSACDDVRTRTLGRWGKEV